MHYGFHNNCALWFLKPKWVMPGLNKRADHPTTKTLERVNQISNRTWSDKYIHKVRFPLVFLSEGEGLEGELRLIGMVFIFIVVSLFSDRFL